MHGLEDGINAVRATLPHCWFAEDECSTGIRHLKAYRKDWDDDARLLERQAPTRQLDLIAADAFRYMSMAWREVSPDPVAAPTPKEIVKAMCKPRTISEWWTEYVNDRRERDEELPEDFEDFNLNNKKMEMK